MKRWICLAVAGALLLSLCCCTGAAPSAPAQTAQTVETPAPSIAVITLTLAPGSFPTDASTPAPVPTATPAPTPEPTATPQPRPLVEIVEEMAVYYARDGERAWGKVEALLDEMAVSYPEDALKWAKIMDRWQTLDERVIVSIGVLPDGLPDTDELCIVTLGYALNANGTMKDQLKARLKVALNSAKKYPNAWVLCTGGGTASKKKGVTEAGQMSAWLKKQGLSKSRILTEKASRTTAANAWLTLELLHRDHPEIKYIAVVSGDYHVKVGVLLFEAAAILQAAPDAEPAVQILGWAGCKSSIGDLSPGFRAGGLIELAGNRDAASQLYFDRYDMNKYPPLP